MLKFILRIYDDCQLYIASHGAPFMLDFAPHEAQLSNVYATIKGRFRLNLDINDNLWLYGIIINYDE